MNRSRQRPTSAPMSPADFAIHASGGKWVLAKHLSFLNRKLMAVARGDIDRLMISCAPRHGKSEFCSKYFPAWYLGIHPDRKVVIATYGSEFAEKWSGEVRDILAECGQATFGIHVDRNAAVGHWAIRGQIDSMFAVGIGKGLSGRGADLLVIDDPIADAQQALSDIERNKAWDWWLSVAKRRLEPNASVIIIMTRWHEDDLAGRLLAASSRGGKTWDVVNLPALAEDNDVLGRAPGEALWPERFPAHVLEEIRDGEAADSDSGGYWFEAQYQGNPIPKAGGMFQAEWLTRNIIPAPLGRQAARCRFWDLAASEGKGDWTVGVLMAAESTEGPFVIEDVIRGRWGVDGVDQTVKTTAAEDARRFGPVMIRGEEEGGASGKKATQAFVRMLSRYDVRCERNTGSKVDRARPMASQCAVNNVKLVMAPWNRPFIDELARFDRGKNDDQVDAASGAFNCLALGHAARWGPDPLGGYRGRRA